MVWIKFLIRLNALWLIMSLVSIICCSTTVLGQDSLTVLYNNLAVIYASNQSIELAETYLDSARQQSPHNPAILNNIANCMLCRGQYSMALDVYRQILQMQTEDKWPLFNMSVALYISDSRMAPVVAFHESSEIKTSELPSEYSTCICKRRASFSP